MSNFTNHPAADPKKTKNPLAVIIPTFNRPALLALCLGSLARTGVFAAGVPVLVCDDGSPPDTAELNRSHCNEFGALFLHETPGRGPARARNRGILVATGAGWCAFLDDDVAVAPDWYPVLCDAIAAAPVDCVGLEGAVLPGGDGMWDREVENTTGGSYITANMVWRRSILRAEGMFDEGFRGPYAEDHELSVRMARHGTAVFHPSLRVTHAPRDISASAWIAGAPRRMRRVLAAEFHFWMGNRSRYHMRRANHSFPRFLYREIFFHAAAEFRRRDRASWKRYPFESLGLVVAALFEQALIMRAIPGYLRRIAVESSRLPRGISSDDTAGLWKSSGPAARELLFGYRPFRGLVFGLLRRPVYNLRSLQRSAPSTPRRDGPAVYLRIDDVFLSDRGAVDRLCAVLGAEGVPWLAAVTGDDCLRPDAPARCADLVAAGATIALHGFSHTGRFGPYQSEILQLTYNEINTRLAAVRSALGSLPSVFVPPFNGIDWEQILFLAGRFSVVCGGPETARFSGLLARPVALSGGGVYFPAFDPCYGTACRMLSRSVDEAIAHEPAPVCLALHMADEAKDDFAALRRLVVKWKPFVSDWQALGHAGEKQVV